MGTIRLLLAILLLCCHHLLPAQSSDGAGNTCLEHTNRVLDETLRLMQKHYYKKDSVQWDTLVSAAKIRLKQTGNCDDAYATVKWCFRQMNERHSFIMPATKASVYNGDVNSGDPVVEKISGSIRTELLEKEIAYIDVPWLSSANQTICTAFADSLQALIATYDRQAVRKWIIDLRKNTGGNCWPMLAGLAPLLGNGIYGYFVSSNEKIPFSYEDGSMRQGKYTRCSVTNAYQLTYGTNTIVLLTGNNTASAGEILALAFKGRDNVYLFGEPTAGLTTANATYSLSDGSLLVLPVCREADRNGIIQTGRIIPDELVISNNNSGTDAVKIAAIMFLQTR